ncbi:MAG: hypothetical protein IT364_23385 [Candidatus Hydrogenedentes bacterium]|nr:hypothetical protein [Candidatus Hydrogenedentota bacterium]
MNTPEQEESVPKPHFALSYAPWPTRYSLFVVCLAATVLLLMRWGMGARADLEHRQKGAYDASSLGLAAAMSATQADGLLPPLDPAPGHLRPKPGVGHPAYLVDGRVKSLEAKPDAGLLLSYLDDGRAFTMKELFDSCDFFYLGYAVVNEEEGAALVKAYQAHVTRGLDFEDDLPAGTGTLGTGTLYRLRIDLVERLAEAGVRIDPVRPPRIPVFVERPGHYDTPGGWVIYLDRGVEWLPYPGPFPMTEAFIQALEAISPPPSS